MAEQIPKKDPASLAVLSGLIDLTSLEGSDTKKSIRELCRKAIKATERFPFLHTLASVCVYPVFIPVAKKELEGSGIRVAAVTGGFPHGQSCLALKLQETKQAIEEGADEIDFVFSRGRFLEGDLAFVQEEVVTIKKCCGTRLLKVILETGELQTGENITNASRIALESGADFIKTSTGKSKTGATLQAVDCMAKAILVFREKTKNLRGLKISGGVADSKTALDYISLVESVLGKEYINSKTLRFGASRLFDDILATLYK